MKIDLYCFPYAGASTMMYSTWKHLLNPCFNLQLIELAGRGSRLGDENEESIEKIGEHIFDKLKKRSDPYMLFGHSMGVLIIGEILKNVFQYNYSKPMRVFFSGRNPLHCRYEGATPYDEDNSIFKENLLSLGGFSEQLKNSSALDLFVPILKSDFRIIENYHYSPCQEKWNFPLTIFSGTYDVTTSYEEILKWADYTSGICDFVEFPDDHFFINNKISEITGVINTYAE
jgi:surfactin synthase thioesterase subunit